MTQFYKIILDNDELYATSVHNLSLLFTFAHSSTSHGVRNANDLSVMYASTTERHDLLIHSTINIWIHTSQHIRNSNSCKFLFDRIQKSL